MIKNNPEDLCLGVSACLAVCITKEIRMLEYL